MENSIVTYLQTNMMSPQDMYRIISQVVIKEGESKFEEGYNFCLQKVKAAREAKKELVRKAFYEALQELNDYVNE